MFREKVSKLITQQKQRKEKDNLKMILSGGEKPDVNLNLSPAMVKSDERAYNLIKKIFNSSINKKNIGVLNGAFESPNNNEHPHQAITIKPSPKKSLYPGAVEQEDEADGYDSDEDSFEDEDNSKYDILKANRYLLYFSSKQDFLAQEFYDTSCKRTVGHLKIMMGAFIVVYLFQTLIIISVRYFITHYLTILLIKGCIAFVMIIFLFLVKGFYRSVLMKFILFLLSIATLVLAVVQGYNSQVKELNTVQSIELVLLFAFTSYLP